MLLQAATGQSVTAYMQAKLWEPLGMESPAYWMIDDDGMEMVFGGLNATARDYAKLGELYRLQGQWQGSQLVPAQWVTDSITPDAPHLLPGENPMSDFDMGYGYQWWIMDGDRGDYSAIGVYNQFIYVDPSKGLVVVKLSANSDYAATNEESSFREFETIEFMRAIGDLF
jgi:CubicO group peptidase (beta-lactamase class C family)